MSVVKLTCDLWTPLGRKLMRAWLDVMEAEEQAAEQAPATGPGWVAEARASLRGSKQGSEIPAGAMMAAPAPTDEAGGATVPAAPAALIPPPETPAPAPIPKPMQAERVAAEPVRQTPPVAATAEPLPLKTDCMDDADKRRAWEMSEKGMRPPAIAKALRREYKQVANYLYNVRKGLSRVPPAPAEPSRELVAVATHRGAVVAEERRAPAVDPEIAAKREAELAQRQLDGFVRRELYS